MPTPLPPKRTASRPFARTSASRRCSIADIRSGKTFILLERLDLQRSDDFTQLGPP